jgi:hypothetical protein
VKAESFTELHVAVNAVAAQWHLFANGILDAERDALYGHKVCMYTPDFDDLLAAITELQGAATRFQMYYHASITDVSAVDP